MDTGWDGIEHQGQEQGPSKKASASRTTKPASRSCAPRWYSPMDIIATDSTNAKTMPVSDNHRG